MTQSLVEHLTNKEKMYKKLGGIFPHMQFYTS